MIVYRDELYRTTVCVEPVMLGDLRITSVSWCSECGLRYVNMWGYPKGAMLHASWWNDVCPTCAAKRVPEIEVVDAEEW